MTRVKAEIDEMWQEVFLGNEKYFRLDTGGTPSTERKEYWENGTIPWVSSGEVHKKVIHEADGRITEQGYRNSNARFYPVNSILIALAGQGKTRGTAAITEIEVTSNQSIAAVIPNQELIDPYFVYYYLDSLYEELRSISAGAGRAGLSLAILAKVAIKIPEKPTQTKIAMILRSTDREIDQTEKLIEKQQRIKRGLLHDLLTKGIDENGATRSEATHEFKDSPLGRIPKEWRVGTVLDVPAKNRPCIQTGPFGAQLSPKDFQPSGIPVLKIGNVQSGYIDLSNLDYVNESKAEVLRRYKIKTGDLLFARQGATTGRNALASSNCGGWLINYHIIRVAVDDTKCLPNYLEFCFNSHYVQNQIGQSKARSNRDGLNSSDIAGFRFPIRTIKEQYKIVDTLLSLITEIGSNSNLLYKYQKLKKGLMQDLLTGKVRVKCDQTIEN